MGLAKETLDLRERSGMDIETIFRAGLNLIPYLGGTLEVILFSNKDKKEIAKIITFLVIVQEQLIKLDDNKLDKSYLKTDEFYFLLKRTLDLIKTETRSEKIHKIKAFLLKSMLKEEFAPRHEVDKEYILLKIEKLELSHFRILEWYFQNNFLEPTQIGSEYKDRKEELGKITVYYKEFENDLMVNGLLEDISSGRFGGGHLYVPSALCKVIWNFIKYDDETLTEETNSKQENK